MDTKKLPTDLQLWVDARKRFHLSHAHIQMARELGLNPKKLGKLDNHHQERWKAPLPQFIEQLYFKRFGRERPEVVMSIEERFRAKAAKKEARRVHRRSAREAGASDAVTINPQEGRFPSTQANDGDTASLWADDDPPF